MAGGDHHIRPLARVRRVGKGAKPNTTYVEISIKVSAHNRNLDVGDESVPRMRAEAASWEAKTGAAGPACTHGLAMRRRSRLPRACAGAHPTRSVPRMSCAALGRGNTATIWARMPSRPWDVRAAYGLTYVTPQAGRRTYRHGLTRSRLLQAEQCYAATVCAAAA